MLLSTALLSFVALATSFHSDPSNEPRALGYTGLRFSDGINFTREMAPQRLCAGPSHLSQHRSHSGLPLAWTRDCRSLELAWRHSAVRGSFAIPATQLEKSSGFHTIVHHNTCNLAVASPRGYGISFGDTDVKRILYSAMQRASHGSLMSAEGYLPCPDSNGLGNVVMTWQLYGTAEPPKKKTKSG
ncbi:uncharacterized protein F5Z01DRAFT_547452 [Emericellopsis atlantica]|uniref:Ecp2 effector protein-like domain-containing protein n=1 Tax=Emericellopsis atlantica TaxID=2614577 RepID=A0A9P8CQQ7_9HYPO|nr:uncharacterized protein F5Z01DRAFT_547452 [Emericellopsis atlantica]KAG9255552.1 hypothetical protein F5Z01DRAFT_547452 [Emericellopsis atlantica]